MDKHIEEPQELIDYPTEYQPVQYTDRYEPELTQEEVAR